MKHDNDVDANVFFSGEAAWLEVPVIDQCCMASAEGVRCSMEIDHHIVVRRPDGSVQHFTACFVHGQQFRARAHEAKWTELVDKPPARRGADRVSEPARPRGSVDGVPLRPRSR